MERFAAVKIADNIISPCGFSSEENYLAVKQGNSNLHRYSKWGLPEPFVASLLDRELLYGELEQLRDAGARTLFENLAILSVEKAVKGMTERSMEDCRRLDLSSDRVLFILSTTKGNVFLLDELSVACNEFGYDTASISKERVLPGKAAETITDYFGNKAGAVVVSNACISGLCAQIEAVRALRSGDYDYAVVIGCDLQSPFIVSGFQSFKALSGERCRPFDINRNGLNLGEAVATIIYKG